MFGMEFLIQALGLDPVKLKADIAMVTATVLEAGRTMQEIKSQNDLILKNQAIIMARLGSPNPETENGESTESGSPGEVQGQRPATSDDGGRAVDLRNDSAP